MSRVAIITLTPDGESKADIQTGGVSNLEILDALKTISGHFARQLLEEYTDLTGDKDLDPDKMDQYMDFLRKNKL
jgi:hypothetical protein